jgi:hypothetical protein
VRGGLNGKRLAVSRDRSRLLKNNLSALFRHNGDRFGIDFLHADGVIGLSGNGLII